MANIIQTFPAGTSTGGSGHTILDANGSPLPQESKLQFEGLSVTDDSSNQKTKIAGEGLNDDSINDIVTIHTPPAVYIGDANKYSTSEKIVGEWIDGKPIYQITKIYTGSWASSTARSVLETLSGIDTIINISSWGIYNNTHMTLPYQAANNFAGVWANETGKNSHSYEIYFQRAAYSSTFTKLVTTIQYTKS